MAKKNKDIEVKIEEMQQNINGENKTVTQLFIGKKMIGELIPQEKNFEIIFDGETKGMTKSLDDGIEAVIREWNLQD